jgi:hypothetical protein
MNKEFNIGDIVFFYNQIDNKDYYGFVSTKEFPYLDIIDRPQYRIFLFEQLNFRDHCWVDHEHLSLAQANP